jgi:hypothetical protein
MTLGGTFGVGMIAVEVESKPAPFEKRKGCGTQALHPSVVSFTEKSRSLTRKGAGSG